MAAQLFRLRNVPDDEAQEIRDLLSRHHIDHGQLEEAKELIEQYQNQRLARVRDEREKRKREGKKPSYFADFLENPIQVILYAAIAAVILYFSIKPFLNFGQ
jgi:hypothetical protein